MEAEFNQIWRQIEPIAPLAALDPTDEGKSEDDLKAEYRNIAERRVRLGLLLAEIGRRHKIEVTDEEVGQAIVGASPQFPGPGAPGVRSYQRNPHWSPRCARRSTKKRSSITCMELIKVTNADRQPRRVVRRRRAAGAASKKAKKTKAAKAEN